MRLFTLLLAAAGTLVPLPGATVVHCGKLLDVRSGSWTVNAVIVVEGSNILAAGPASSVTIPSGALHIDLAQGACLPGLMDVHVHLTADPRYAGFEGLSVSVPRSTVTGVKNARATLQAGFTTVRNVGASGYSDVALRDGINDGDVEGPRMFVSGPPLGITGGHCDNNLLAPEFNSAKRGSPTDPGRLAPKCGK